MLTQEPESGMCRDEVTFSYSKRAKTPEPVEPAEPNFVEKLYVGHLPYSVSKRELDDLFGSFGQLYNIEVKHGGYAFVQYKLLADAEEAVKSLHNYSFQGKRITVEFSNKKGAGADTCLVCGQQGHWARDCPDSKEKGLDVKSGKCFKCGSFGHLARFCRNQGNGENNVQTHQVPRYRGSSPRRRMRGRSRSPGQYRERSPEYYHDSRRPFPPGNAYDSGYYSSPRDYDYYRGGYDYYRGGYSEPCRERNFRDPYYDMRDLPPADRRMDFRPEFGIGSRSTPQEGPRDFEPIYDERRAASRSDSYAYDDRFDRPRPASREGGFHKH